MLKQKAALFGFDARVAIIIFGTIAGIASYYGADKIKQMQDLAAVTQVDVLRQASLQVISDNGGDFNTGVGGILNANFLGSKDLVTNLLSSGKNNISYIDVPDGSAESYITINTSTNKMQVDHLNLYSSTNIAGAGLSLSDCDKLLTNCYYWLRINNVSENNYSLIEAFYDDNISDYSNVTNIAEGIAVAVNIAGTPKLGTVLIKLGERDF